MPVDYAGKAPFRLVRGLRRQPTGPQRQRIERIVAHCRSYLQQIFINSKDGARLPIPATVAGILRKQVVGNVCAKKID